MGLNKKGSAGHVKKKTTNNGNEVITSTTGTSQDISTTEQSSSSSSSTSTMSSRVHQEARTSAEIESHSNVLEMTSSSREVVMDSKGNIIQVIDSAPKTVRQGTSTGRDGLASDKFIQGEILQTVIQGKEIPDDKQSMQIVKNDRRLSEEITGHTESLMTSSTSVVTSSSFIEEASCHSDVQTQPNIRTSSRSTETKESSKIVSEGRERDGQMYIDTMRTDEMENRQNVDGNVVASRSKNIQNERTVEPAVKPGHVTFIDDKTSSIKCVPSLRPGESAWDGKFVYEKPPVSPGRMTVTPTGSDTTKVIKNISDDVTTSSDVRQSSHIEESTRKSSSSEITTSSYVSEIHRSSEDENIEVKRSLPISADTTDFSEHTTRYNRPGDSSWDGKFVIESTTKDLTKTIKSPTVVRLTDKKKDTVEVKDVTEDHNVVESTTTSYTVEYKDSSDGKRVEKITSVSATIPEEDISQSPRGTSTPKRANSPEKNTRTDSNCYKPGQSSWDGHFIYEKPQTTTKTPRSTPDSTRPNVKTIGVDIRDVTEDYTINDADIITTSYVVETSASQASSLNSRDSNVTYVTRDTNILDNKETLKDKRPETPEKTERDNLKPGSSAWDGTFRKPEPAGRSFTIGRKPNISDTTINLSDYPDSTTEVISESIIVEQSRIHESYKDSANIDLSSTAVETVIIVDGKPLSRTGDYSLDSTNTPSTTITRENITRDTERKSDGDRKSPFPEDRSPRPTKPGSSSWDGKFVYEKAVDTKVDKKKPIAPDGQSKDISRRPDSHKPSNIAGTKKFTTSQEFIIAEKSINSDINDSTIITTTFFDGPNGPENRTKDRTSPQRTESPDKSPGDRTTRPDKPGSSTWDGHFVYEKPVEPKGDIKKKPVDDDRQPKELSRRPEVYKPTSNVTDVTQEFITVEKTLNTDRRGSTNYTTTIYDGPEAPDRRSRDKITPERPESPEKSPGGRATRPDKPGSSTWDGHFVNEKPVEPKGDKNKPIGHNIIDVPQNFTSQEFITIEKSHNSDTNDTTIITTTFHDTPGGPENRPSDKTSSQRPESPEKSPGGRTTRPDKPGSSTWDGHFVYEKPVESKKPVDNIPEDSKRSTVKKPRDSKSPDDQRPTSITELTTNISDIPHDHTSTTTAFKNIEKTSVIDSKTYDSSNFSTTIIHEIPDTRKPVGPGKKPDSRPTSPEKSPASPTDRTVRPSKPGSSTWDGSFTYEKPQEPKKPTDKRKPNDRKDKPNKPINKVNKPVPSDSTVRSTTLTLKDDQHDKTFIVEKSFITEKSSSFTDIVQENYISEFKDTRDTVS